MEHTLNPELLISLIALLAMQDTIAWMVAHKNSIVLKDLTVRSALEIQFHAPKDFLVAILT